jgi:hypothetical protein
VVCVEEMGDALDAGIVEGLGLDGEEGGGGEGAVLFRDEAADGVEEEWGAVVEIAEIPVAAGDPGEIGEKGGSGGAIAGGDRGLDDLLEDVDLYDLLPGELLAQPACYAVIDMGE